MPFDALLTGAIDVAFFAALAFTLIDWLRHRDRVHLAVLLVFVSLSTVLGAPFVVEVFPDLRLLVGSIIGPALILQPALVMWLASMVWPVHRRVVRWTFAAAFGLSGIFLVLLLGAQTPAAAVTAVLGLTLFAYFLLVEAAATVALVRAAFRRVGVSRMRMTIAAIATGLLGLALVVLMGGGIVAEPESEQQAGISVVVRIVALFSGLGYLAAFVPPRALRRTGQQALAYNFIRNLNAMASGTPVDLIWSLLERTSQRASGARRATVVLAPASGAGESGAEAPGDGISIVTMPFRSERWPDGRLELDLGPSTLFRDDDLELVGLLLERAVRQAEREALLTERERLIDELRAASAAKSDFLAAMSHELRTPLNAIIGFSELLTEGDDADEPDTVRSYAGHIHGSGLHLLELVNDVLDLSRIEAGRLDLKPVRFDLAGLVDETVATLQSLADQKDLSIVRSLAPVTVDADPGRIRQVVVNLLSNAVKFTEPGGEVRLSLEEDGVGTVRFAVTDTGVGIKPQDVDRIFDAFQQGDRRDRVRHEGTGLGLALSRELVEAHGGTISVESALGVGSTFTVVLPIERSAEVSLEPVPELPQGLQTVLVIEDDPAAQQLLRVHLESAGYGVLVTASGRQALTWLRHLRPDAVILDIVLPEMDGWEILHRLKGDPLTRSIPVMVVSVIDDRQLGLALGAVDYLVKPVSRELLLESIGRLTFTTKVRTRTVTVLVIDPDPEAFGRYRAILEPDGFRVIAATDGTSGRRRAINDLPDLILLDAMLTDVDGFELAASLRHDPQTADIPIWLTTPGALAPDAKQRLNGHVQGVLQRGDDALVALRGWLATGRAAPRTTPEPQATRPEPDGGSAAAPRQAPA